MEVPLVEVGLATDVGLAVQRTRRVQDVRESIPFLCFNAFNRLYDGRITGSAFIWKEIDWKEINRRSDQSPSKLSSRRMYVMTQCRR